MVITRSFWSARDRGSTFVFYRLHLSSSSISSTSHMLTPNATPWDLVSAGVTNHVSGWC